jgi:hypothetical protein
MEQLGLLDDIKRLSKPFGKITVLRDDLSVVGTIVGNSKHMDHQQRYCVGLFLRLTHSAESVLIFLCSSCTNARSVHNAIIDTETMGSA